MYGTQKVLAEQKQKGKLIIIASHNQENIRLLCEKNYRFDSGRIIGEINDWS